MDFIDDDGKPMTRQQVIAAGMGHLLDDAPSWRCTECHRKTTDRESAYQKCLMTQPDGTRCRGVFR